MKIVVTANGKGLEAPTSPFFGRCPWYVLVETDTLECETLSNPAQGAAGGAGIQAAQYLVGQGVQGVVSGNVGPNAFQVLRAAGIPVYVSAKGTVQQAVESFQSGQLEAVKAPTAPSHIGLGGRGHGGGRGRNR
jgi:predicted Fe-Mo cluster-binding NifX family protein